MSENQGRCPHCGGITEEHAVLIARREWVEMMTAWREREEDRAALKREYHRKLEALRDPVAELVRAVADAEPSFLGGTAESVLFSEKFRDRVWR